MFSMTSVKTLLIALLCFACGVLPLQAQSDSQAAYQNYRKAVGLLNQKNYDEASEAAAKAAQLAPKSAEIQQRCAEILYRSGKTKKSLPLFDRANELSPEIAPHNWQRGIALGSAGLWKQGAAQFKSHHDVNPDDVENSAWYFLCVAKSKGLADAEKTVIPSRGDGRQPMMSILQMLKKEIKPAEVVTAAKTNTREGYARKNALFYADLYLGLYYDSLNDESNAIKYLKRSMTHGVEGYMADTARVYYNDRFATKSDK